MNKRIQEIYKETTGKDWVYDFDPDYAEKFAELIVRECADLFEVEWGAEKLTGNDVGYVMKKHFGVEE